ncbi:MAG TPA: DUF2585 family protein [Pyrinomonadaceae bacterium]|nr:DUF2585 family protein [Pyrinomonadaceae bacterium]
MTKKYGPWLAGFAAVVAAALLLRAQGRLWMCACGRLLLWTSDAWSADNSQHLSDPYTFTHVLHGFMFAGALALLLPRVSWRWGLALAVAAEAVWEVVENSDAVIRRYREAAGALGYFGDTVVNSVGDIVACAAGFLLARWLGLRRSLVVFAVTELVLLLWIRDSLLLNVLMLLFPLDSIRAWQSGG